MVKLRIIILASLLAGCGYEAPRAWTVVRQRGKENYGYVNAAGAVFAGFTNKAEAEAAMEADRWSKPSHNYKSIWEPVK